MEVIGVFEDGSEFFHKEGAWIEFFGAVVGIVFSIQGEMGEVRFHVFVVADEVTDRGVLLDQFGNESGIGQKLSLRECPGMAGDVFDADGGVVESDGVSSCHPEGEEAIDGPISIDDEVHTDIDPAVGGEFWSAVGGEFVGDKGGKGGGEVRGYRVVDNNHGRVG